MLVYIAGSKRNNEELNEVVPRQHRVEIRVRNVYAHRGTSGEMA